MIQDFLLEVIGNLTQTSPQELLTQLKTDDGKEWKSEKEIAETLNGVFQTRFTKLGNDQLGRGKRETMRDFERELIAEFGVTSNSKGIDLVRDIIANRESETLSKAKAEGVKVGAKKLEDLTLDELKSIPAFNSHVTNAALPLKEALEKTAKDFSEFKAKSEEVHTRNLLQVKVPTILEKMRVALSPNPDLKARQVETIISLLPKGNLRRNNDEIEVIDEKGEPRMDAMLNRVTLENLVAQVNPFEIHQFDPNKSGGGASSKDKDSENGKGGGKEIPVFKTQGEMNLWIQTNGLTETPDFLNSVVAKFNETQAANQQN